MKTITVAFILLIFSSYSYADPTPKTDFALILVDMQPHFAERKDFHLTAENQLKRQAVLNKQVKAIELAKKYEIPILVIETISLSNLPNAIDYGKTSPLLTEAIGSYQKTALLNKTRDNVFDPGGQTFDPKTTDIVHDIMHSNVEDLYALLENWGTKTLIIIGANGGACVNDTIYGAAGNFVREDRSTFNIVTFAPGIIDFNFENFIYPYAFNRERSLDMPNNQEVYFFQTYNTNELDELINQSPYSEDTLEFKYQELINDTELVNEIKYENMRRDSLGLYHRQP